MHDLRLAVRAPRATPVVSIVSAPSLARAGRLTARVVVRGVAVSLTMLVASPSTGRGQAVNSPLVQAAPPRDTRQPPQTGTAVIRGRVVAADTGRPLRRARLTVSAPELGRDNRTTSTGLDGRYEIRDLAAGRYTIRVARAGYLGLQYGQRRPLEQGQPLRVVDKQVVENIDFALPRSSVIRGRVTDEFGDAVEGVFVFAMRTAYWQGRRRLVPAGQAQTDDVGEYRLVGLMPGTYLVMATLRETWAVMVDGVQQMMGYAPTYYPGTAGAADAQRLTVGVGREATGIDFSLIPGRAASVSGTAFDSLGRPLAGRRVGLAQEIRGPNAGVFFAVGGATVASDGTFTIENLPPGQYKLRVQTASEGQTSQAPVQETVTLPITMDGVDITNLTLMTSAGWSMSGQVTTESGIPPDASPDRFTLAALLVDADTAPNAPPGAGNADSGRVKDDWTVSVTGVFGAARLRTTVPDGWTVKAILHDGRDISDTPIEMKSGEALTDVQVIVSQRATKVRGQLVDEKGAPLTDGTVIVFASDLDKWFEDSRWVRSARPDQQGQYVIEGLPPGEYFAVAVEYVEDGMWNDAEYLGSIRQYGQRLTLNEGDSRAVSLKVVTP